MACFSIVIPVYKSTRSLELICSGLIDIQKRTDYEWEIIFVNDSPLFLATEITLIKLQEKYANVNVIKLRKNQGQHIATLVGMSRATGDYVITMDDDLQHPVNEIPNLINAITSDSSIEGIFALPNYRNRKHSLWRTLSSYVLKKIDIVFLNKPSNLVLSSFRIMTMDLAKIVLNTRNAMPAISSLMVNATDDLKNLKVEHNTRKFGKTNYTFPKLLSLALNSILYYSSLPLRILAVVGFFGFLGSMVFIVSVVLRKLLIGIEYPGYASTVTLISFFGGLNLFAVGLIGEYLIRVIKEQNKPDLEDLIK